jgi:hypothetical protein
MKELSDPHDACRNRQCGTFKDSAETQEMRLGKRRFTRKKGKNFFSASVSFTLKEKTFLDALPDYSKWIRGVIDPVIEALESGEAEVNAITLRTQIEIFKKKEEELGLQRRNFIYENQRHWVKECGRYLEPQIVYDDDGTPKALEDEDAQMALKVVKAYDKKIREIGEKIEETKKKIFAT